MNILKKILLKIWKYETNNTIFAIVKKNLSCNENHYILILQISVVQQ